MAELQFYALATIVCRLQSDVTKCRVEKVLFRVASYVFAVLGATLVLTS